MNVNDTARPTKEPLSKPMAFRHLRSRREMLETFQRADGHATLTPILQEAVDVYIAHRIRQSRVRLHDLDSAA